LRAVHDETQANDSAAEALLANNRDYAAAFAHGGLPAAPRRRLAVLTCMDARIDPSRVLGLAPGDAHVIRNAGAVVTDDAIRSLAISQTMLGTREVMVIAHTDCGLLTFTDEAFADHLEETANRRPDWRAHAFDDLEASVRASVERIGASPFLPHTDSVRGFVYEVETGRLREVR